MSCPSCDSNNIRPSVFGVIYDTYYCIDCKKTHERVSRPVKTTGGIIIAGALFGPIGALIGALISGSKDNDGGGNLS